MSEGFSDLDHILELKAQGVSQKDIAKVYQVSPLTISRWLKSPVAQERLMYYRSLFKQVILQRGEGSISKVYNVVDKMADEYDAKGLDAATRAVMNLEKTTASASGEAKQVEVSGPGGQPLQIDVRAIIAQIIAHNEA